MHHPTDRIAHTFVIPVVERGLDLRDCSMGLPGGIDLTTYYTKSRCSTTQPFPTPSYKFKCIYNSCFKFIIYLFFSFQGAITQRFKNRVKCEKLNLI